MICLPKKKKKRDQWHLWQRWLHRVAIFYSRQKLLNVGKHACDVVYWQQHSQLAVPLLRSLQSYYVWHSCSSFTMVNAMRSLTFQDIFRVACHCRELLIIYSCCLFCFLLKNVTFLGALDVWFLCHASWLVIVWPWVHAMSCSVASKWQKVCFF